MDFLNRREKTLDSKLYYDLSINELTKTLEELLEITSDSQQIEDTIDEYRINS